MSYWKPAWLRLAVDLFNPLPALHWHDTWRDKLGNTELHPLTSAELCRAVDFNFESKFEPLLVIWPPFPEVIQQNQLQSSWVHAQAQHWRVWPASANTGRFRDGNSRCWPRTARFRKKCSNSCYTDSSWGYKRFDTWFPWTSDRL